MSNTFQVHQDEKTRTGQVFELFFKGVRSDGSLKAVSILVEPAIKVAEDKMAQAAKLMGLKAIKTNEQLSGMSEVQAITPVEYYHRIRDIRYR